MFVIFTDIQQTKPHVHYSGYTYSQLRPIVERLLECCEDPHHHHQAVYTKYSDKRFKRAAIFVEGEMARGFRIQTQEDPVLALPSLLPVSGMQQGFYEPVSYFTS
jgi:G2/mitotic-specific cyclin 3/4